MWVILFVRSDKQNVLSQAIKLESIDIISCIGPLKKVFYKVTPYQTARGVFEKRDKFIDMLWFNDGM